MQVWFPVLACTTGRPELANLSRINTYFVNFGTYHAPRRQVSFSKSNYPSCEVLHHLEVLALESS
jgi:hypothetical protein